MQAGVRGPRHHGPQENRLEEAAVIAVGIMGEVPVGLSEGGHDLRHLDAEHAVGVGERGAVRALVPLVTLGRMGPDLDAATGNGGSVDRAARFDRIGARYTPVEPSTARVQGRCERYRGDRHDPERSGGLCRGGAGGGHGRATFERPHGLPGSSVRRRP